MVKRGVSQAGGENLKRGEGEPESGLVGKSRVWIRKLRHFQLFSPPYQYPALTGTANTCIDANDTSNLGSNLLRCWTQILPKSRNNGGTR